MPGYRNIARFGALSILLTVGSGCTGTVGQSIDNVLYFGGKEKDVVLQPTEPRYCYRTLGRVNCYSAPLPGQDANRLVGYEGPAPRSTAGTGPLGP